jgi:hypothetical protein
MLLMYGQCYHVIRMHLRPESTQSDFQKKHHPGPRQLLI